MKIVPRYRAGHRVNPAGDEQMGSESSMTEDDEKHIPTKYP